MLPPRYIRVATNTSRSWPPAATDNSISKDDEDLLTSSSSSSSSFVVVCRRGRRRRPRPPPHNIFFFIFAHVVVFVCRLPPVTIYCLQELQRAKEASAQEEERVARELHELEAGTLSAGAMMDDDHHDHVDDVF